MLIQQQNSIMKKYELKYTNIGYLIHRTDFVNIVVIIY